MFQQRLATTVPQYEKLSPSDARFVFAPECAKNAVAEREGFEPSVESPLRSLSKGVLSTTQPPFHDAGQEV